MEKQFMQRVSRLLPSSLANSCHFRNVPDVIDSSILISRNSQTNLPDSFNSSIIPAQPKPKPHVSVSNVTKNSSSSNNSGWFSSEQEEEQYQEALIDPKTETMFSLSSFSSSSEGSLLNPNSCRKTNDNQGRSFDHTVMGYSLSVVSDGSGEFSRETVRKSRRKSSACSCNLYFSDFGSFRREAIQTRRRSGDKVLGCCSFDISGGGGAAESSGEFSPKNTQNSHRQTTKSEPRSVESPEVSSTISTDLGSFRRKTSKNRQRSRKKLSDGEVSSMSSTHLYYSDLGSFRRRETTNTCQKTRKSVRKSRKKMSYGKVGESYAVEKSSRDPYSDFRISMVEMIVEKQIFREEELEKLLECFLFLNSSYHHEIIFKVFLEVCTNLFTQ